MRSNTLDIVAELIPLDRKREQNFCVNMKKKKNLMSVPKLAIVMIENNADICL